MLSACSRELGKVGLLDLFEIPKVELTDVTIENFGDKDYILYRLQSEIQIQYITRKQNLLKTIYTYIANDKTNKQEINYSLYGTNSFNLVWEKVCSENFGSVLNEKISELPLNNALEYESIKNQTLRNIIEKPHWHRNNPKEEDNSAETLKPDMICVYPVDKNEQEYCFGIYDAKYYCIDFSKGKIMGQPGIADITKQYLYQLAYDDFISKQGYKYVQNMFLCPHEQAEKDYGFVEMKMLHQIGDKRLENIAIVNLCATEMYNIYLENRRIDMEHITQYIPSIGRQTVENQNFSNRMLSYLQGITISDKIAEEQFEMTVENRRLIYPQQIKREIGAKIIYDIICSIVCDTFYGFNPYEKEDYSNMIAESIGDSYGRCSQIADVAIEIEKNIKELSDQELQDEKVFKVILKKCFEGKNDITPILEENLEKFMGKVMELVEKIYL